MVFENICTRCKAKGISIARLEREAGLGNATIRGWKESQPNVSSLKRVAAYFGCTVDELLKEETDGE